MRRTAAMLSLLLLAAAPALAEDPPEFSARHILIAWRGATRSEATRSKDEALDLARRVLEELKAPGADFAALSQKYNDDRGAAARGGDLGIFERGLMTPPFQAAVEALKDGELSGVVETEFGYHLIQRTALAEALSRLEADTAVFLGVLFPFAGQDPASARTKEQALADAGRAAEHLRAGGAAAACPADCGAKPLTPAFGSLRLRRGQAKPEFSMVEEHAFALKVGEVSAPFETPLGVMVVKRVSWWRKRLAHFLVMHAGSARCPPGVTRTKEEAKARAAEALAKFEADPASWATLVASYSDEPGAAGRQGSLGAVEPGMMVPDFDAAVASLAPGGHTGVIETPYGFHVVRRTD